MMEQDPERLKVTIDKAANQFLTKKRRKSWGVGGKRFDFRIAGETIVERC